MPLEVTAAQPRQLGAQLVLAGRRVLLDEASLPERVQNAVHRALRQAQASRGVGKAEPALPYREEPEYGCGLCVRTLGGLKACAGTVGCGARSSGCLCCAVSAPCALYALQLHLFDGALGLLRWSVRLDWGRAPVWCVANGRGGRQWTVHDGMRVILMSSDGLVRWSVSCGRWSAAVISGYVMTVLVRSCSWRSCRRV